MKKTLLALTFYLFTLILFINAVLSEEVNLNSWTSIDKNGNWAVSEDGKSVQQTINGTPTFFVSNFELSNDYFEGTFKMANDNDDDFVGFAFAFKDLNQPFYLVTWKKLIQTTPAEGTAEEGLKLLKLFNPQQKDYWDGENNDSIKVLKTSLGSGTGWAYNTNYRYKLSYKPEGIFRILIYKDETVLWDTEQIIDPEPIGKGKVAFFNYSQSKVMYEGFTQITMQPPVAIISGDLTFDANCLSITLNAKNSYDPDGYEVGFSAIESLQWDIGNDGISDDFQHKEAHLSLTLQEAINKGLSVNSDVLIALEVEDADDFSSLTVCSLKYISTPPEVNTNGSTMILEYGDSLHLTGIVNDIDLNMNVNENVTFEWDYSEAKLSDEIGDGFSNLTQVTLSYNQLLPHTIDKQVSLYLNAKDASQKITTSKFIISMVIDDIAPEITSYSPSELMKNPFSFVDIIFNESIAIDKMIPQNFSLLTPDLNTMTISNVTHLNNNQWRIHFSEISQPGQYILSLNSNITDLTGNHLAQNSEIVLKLSTGQEKTVLMINVHGGYDTHGYSIHKTLEEANANVYTFVNLGSSYNDEQLKSIIEDSQFDQIWVFDLSSNTDNYPLSWQAIADWFNKDKSRVLICDGRIISSYWYNRNKTEGKLLSQNYYENMKIRNGGLLLGTDHDAFHTGINLINEKISISTFKGNIPVSEDKKISIDTKHPLMNFPNKIDSLMDDSSPGRAPNGRFSDNIYLHYVAWHGNPDGTPNYQQLGITSTIQGSEGFKITICSPKNETYFVKNQSIPFTISFTNTAIPFTYTCSMDDIFITSDKTDELAQNFEHSISTAGMYTFSVFAMGNIGNDNIDYVSLIIHNAPFTPNTPFPLNHMKNVSTSTKLSWKGGDPDQTDTVKYDIYFGETNPPPLYTSSYTSTVYYLNTALEHGHEYYWKIIAKDNHSAVTESFIWSFTVADQSIDEGLFANYSFDGNTLDTCGNENHLTPVNNINYDEGLFFQSAIFDGHNALRLSNHDAFINDSFSICFWMKGNSTKKQHLFQIGNFEDNQSGFLFYILNGSYNLDGLYFMGVDHNGKITNVQRTINDI